MNYNLLYSPLNIPFLRLRNHFLLLSFLFCMPAVLIFTIHASAQSTNWLYVTTVPDGTKGYLNDEVKMLPNGNKSVWEKIIMLDGSSAIALSEWDCRNKRRVTRQVTYYNPDLTRAGTKKKPFEWSEVVPGSAADFTYRRVCLAIKPVKWAQINVRQASLRSLPDESAPVLRIARQGEKFQIVPETGKGEWFNVVDATTQQDYWLHGNTFKIVEVAETKQVAPKTEKHTQPPATPKPKAKQRRKQRN
jgi:hypothetical protein